MKKYIATLLIGAAALSLASCNNHKWTDSLDYTTRGSTESISTSQSSSGTIKPIDPSEITGDVVVELEDGLTVYESYDLEKHAIKLIFVGDKEYYFPNLNPEYVVNVKYDLFQNSGGSFQANMLPMETPIAVYLPISEYIKGSSFTVRWDSKNDKLETTHHDISYRPTIDVYSYYSDEPIRVRDEFLHFVLTKHFGGEYSERDLLSIRMLVYTCDVLNLDTFQRISNCIVIETEESDLNYDHIQYRYYYSQPNNIGNYEAILKRYLIITCPEVYTDCESQNQPVLVPDEVIEDVERYFHGLYKIGFSPATQTPDGKLDKETILENQEKYRLLAEQILKKKEYIATDIPNYTNGKN